MLACSYIKISDRHRQDVLYTSTTCLVYIDCMSCLHRLHVLSTFPGYLVCIVIISLAQIFSRDSISIHVSSCLHVSKSCTPGNCAKIAHVASGTEFSENTWFILDRQADDKTTSHILVALPSIILPSHASVALLIR